MSRRRRPRQLLLICAMLSTVLVSIEASQMDIDRADEVSNANEIDKQVSIGDSGLPCGVGFPSSSGWSHQVGRIFGGVEAEPGEFPWMVNIRKVDYGHWCGGVIIDERHILTVAHCFDYRVDINEKLDMFTFSIGDYNQANPDGERIVAIERVLYTTSRPNNLTDFALVKTKHPMKFRLTKERFGSVNRICLTSPLPPISDPNFKFQHGLRVTVAGWGRTKTSPESLTLMKVDESINYCNVPSNENDSRILCTSGPIGMGACHGDSGGPLVVRSASGQFILAGLVRGGPNNCTSNDIDDDRRYANVYHYLPWIREVSKPLINNSIRH